MDYETESYLFVSDPGKLSCCFIGAFHCRRHFQSSSLSQHPGTLKAEGGNKTVVIYGSSLFSEPKGG